jgi:hypothetical protein
MKSKNIYLAVAASWIVFIFLDGAGALLRAWYLRKMAIPFRFFYLSTRYGRGVMLFALGVLNFLLLADKMREEIAFKAKKR